MSIGLNKGADLTGVNEINFDTTYVPTIDPSGGSIWWNNKEYTINVQTGLGPTIQVGQEILLLWYNDTGSKIDNFSVVRPKAATLVGGVVIPTPELAQANSHETCEGTLTVMTMDMLDGQLGFSVVFGRARNGNSSSCTPGDDLFLSATTAGALTNIEPEFPNYKISMGGCLVSDPLNGEVFVSRTRNIFQTINDAWDGSIRETIDFLVSSDGANIIGTLSNSYDSNRDLTMMFSDGFTTLDTTTAPLTVALTPGADNNPQENFVYIPKSTKVLTISTSDWPTDVEHIKIAQLNLRSAVTTQLEGAFRNQNWNDHIKLENDNGHLLHITEKLRQFEAQWESGTEGSATVTISDEVFIKVTAGVIYQLHRQNFPIIDMTQINIDAVNQGSKTFTIIGEGDLTGDFPAERFISVHSSTGNDGLYTVASTSYADPNFNIVVNEAIPSAVADGVIGDDIHIVNDFTTPYLTLNDLALLTTDASGVALLNTSFSIVVWGVINKSGQPSHIMGNAPTGTYNKNFPDTAVDDATNQSVYTIPKQFQGVGFLIARYTFVNNGGIWSLYDTEDLRGKIPNTTAGGGGGGAGVTTFTGLTDTPSSYTSQAFKLPKVNSAETALEFSSIVEDVDGNVDIYGMETLHPAVDGWPVQVAIAASDTFWQGFFFDARRSRGTESVPTNVQAGDNISSFESKGYNSGGTGTSGTDRKSAQYRTAVDSVSGSGATLAVNGKHLFELSSDGTLYDTYLEIKQALSTFSHPIEVPQISSALQTLTDAATIAWDANNGMNAVVTLGGNRTLGAPTNLREGTYYTLKVIQDATGTRTLAYNSIFIFPGGNAPILTATGTKFDLLGFFYDGTNMIFTGASYNPS
jgi:hypothetical protein